MDIDASLGWVEGLYEEDFGPLLKSAYSGAHPLCRPFLEESGLYMQFENGNFILNDDDRNVLRMPGREVVSGQEADCLIDAASLAQDHIMGINVLATPLEERKELWADKIRSLHVLECLQEVLSENLPISVDDAELTAILDAEL